MPRKGGKRPGAGRRWGSKNKTTIERETREREVAQTALAETRIKEARGEKLGKDVLEDFMKLFMGLAARHQPLPPGAAPPPGHQADETRFQKYARLAVWTADKLAAYQSPKYAAVAVAMTPGIPTALPAPTPLEPTQIEGIVVAMDDPVALARFYQSKIRAAR